MGPSSSSDNNTGCSPVSSNCVIWQGPDIACINLCKGDNVSSVVYKLAEQVIELETELNLSDLDLQCLVAECVQCPDPDKSLKAVLTLIINELCVLTGGTNPGVGGNAELIPVAACFRVIDMNGDPVLNMSANSYIDRIGIAFCAALTNLAALTSAQENQDQRLTALENYVHPEYANPTIFASCIFPGDTVPVDIVEAFEMLESQFCNLRSVTGLPTPLAQALNAQCVGLNTAPALSINAAMSALPNWKPVVSTLADSLINLWATVCDMRAGIQMLMSTIPTGCGLLTIDYAVTLTGSGPTLAATIVFLGHVTIPDAYSDCPALSTLVITDAAGNSITRSLNVSALKAVSGGVSYSLAGTALNTASNYTFTLNTCLTNGVNTCSKSTIKTISNIAICPTVTYTAGTGSLSYSFNNTGSAGTGYTIDLLNAAGTVIMQSQAVVPSSPTVAGTFTGLLAGTLYNIRITISNGVSPYVCSIVPATTLTLTCLTPTGLVAAVFLYAP